MKLSPAHVTLCSTCGRILDAKGDCLACLVRVGFDQPPSEFASPVFGDFEIVRREDGSFWELGRGAMGVTYRADDKVLNRSVALKVIDVPEAAGDGQMVRDRFLREARAAAAFRHPNVAGVFHFGASPGGDGCYYAMELVEGETLEVLVRRDGPLKVEAALEVAVQVTRALIAAAAHGLIHRDLKPGNIMLTHGTAAELDVKVIDFGLAKAITDAGHEMDLTKDGFVGTPAFASPEQFSGAPADARSDIYSLGVTLWYALTGEVPYPGKTIEEIRQGQTEVALPVEQLIARKIPTPVIQLLRRILAMDPMQRPASARELMGALESCRVRLGFIPPPGSKVWRTGQKFAAAFVALSVIGGATFFAMRLQQHKTPVPPPAPAKSIAVLPFENLSAEKENAFFADGMQDDILAALSKIEGLKVISRTSTISYRAGANRNLRMIAQELGVAHILEGSVRRAGGKVRVTTQLIEAKSDAHLWADTYDRDLADVFAIQSDIALRVAAQLRAKLSSSERAAIERPVTADLVAFDLYTRAKTTRLMVGFGPLYKDRLVEAVKLLDLAVERDPGFFVAWCELATIHDNLYFAGYDQTPARLRLAENAMQTALRLLSDAGAAHLVRAQHLYNAYRDYGGARTELETAQRTLPNSAEIAALTGYIDRRQGRWDESTVNLERAIDLDPRNWFTLSEIAVNYSRLRRYARANAVLERAAAIVPKDVTLRVNLGWISSDWKADLRPLHATIQAILVEDPAAAGTVAADWLHLALCERDLAMADRALAALKSDDALSLGHILLPRAFGAGLVARVRGNAAEARTAFTSARIQQEEAVRAQPENAPALCALGLIDAALGRKEEALREGRRALDLLPVQRDALAGADLIVGFAIICAWAGESDLALEQLAIAAGIPSLLNYGQLKLHPWWDPLRGDARFENLVASLAPKPGGE